MLLLILSTYTHYLFFLKMKLMIGLAGQLIHGMLHDWFIVQSGGS